MPSRNFFFYRRVDTFVLIQNNYLDTAVDNCIAAAFMIVFHYSIFLVGLFIWCIYLSMEKKIYLSPFSHEVTDTREARSYQYNSLLLFNDFNRQIISIGYTTYYCLMEFFFLLSITTFFSFMPKQKSQRTS